MSGPAATPLEVAIDALDTDRVRSDEALRETALRRLRRPRQRPLVLVVVSDCDPLSNACWLDALCAALGQDLMARVDPALAVSSLPATRWDGVLVLDNAHLYPYLEELATGPGGTLLAMMPATAWAVLAEHTGLPAVSLRRIPPPAAAVQPGDDGHPCLWELAAFLAVNGLPVPTRATARALALSEPVVHAALQARGGTRPAGPLGYYLAAGHASGADRYTWPESHRGRALLSALASQATEAEWPVVLGAIRVLGLAGQYAAAREMASALVATPVTRGATAANVACRILADAGCTEAARAVAKRWQEVEPGQSTRAYEMARLEWQFGAWQAARQLLHQCDDARRPWLLARIDAGDADPEAPREPAVFATLAEQAADGPALRMLRAQHASRTGDAAAAEDHCQSALRYVAFSASLLSQWSACRRLRGDLPGALHLLEKARLNEPHNPAHPLARSAVLLEQGKFDEARALLVDDVLPHAPHWPIAQSCLARLDATHATTHASGATAPDAGRPRAAGDAQTATATALAGAAWHTRALLRRLGRTLRQGLGSPGAGGRAPRLTALAAGPGGAAPPPVEVRFGEIRVTLVCLPSNRVEAIVDLHSAPIGTALLRVMRFDADGRHTLAEGLTDTEGSADLGPAEAVRGLFDGSPDLSLELVVPPGSMSR